MHSCTLSTARHSDLTEHAPSITVGAGLNAWGSNHHSQSLVYLGRGQARGLRDVGHNPDAVHAVVPVDDHLIKGFARCYHREANIRHHLELSKAWAISVQPFFN